MHDNDKGSEKDNDNNDNPRSFAAVGLTSATTAHEPPFLARVPQLALTLPEFFTSSA